MTTANATQRLHYGALLLSLMRREAMWRTCTDWPRVLDLCDRFERVMASLHRPTLVW